MIKAVYVLSSIAFLLLILGYVLLFTELAPDPCETLPHIVLAVEDFDEQLGAAVYDCQTTKKGHDEICNKIALFAAQSEHNHHVLIDKARQCLRLPSTQNGTTEKTIPKRGNSDARPGTGKENYTGPTI